MLSKKRRGRRADAGFTLVELILSVSLLGVILLTLSLVMLSMARVNQETTDRLKETRDEQFVAAYFATDVAGATEFATNAAARCGTGTALIELLGVSYEPANPTQPRTTIATYVFTTTTVDGVTTGTLTRRACEAPQGVTPYPWTPSQSVTVAHRLASTTPAVTCFTGTSPASCSAITTKISVTFDRLSGGDPFVLTGTRRTTP